MLILMENEKHGRHHFYSEREAEQAALNGWKRVSDVVETVYNDSTAQPAKAELADSPPAKTEKRRGRPPKGA